MLATLIVKDSNRNVTRILETYLYCKKKVFSVVHYLLIVQDLYKQGVIAPFSSLK